MFSTKTNRSAHVRLKLYALSKLYRRIHGPVQTSYLYLRQNFKISIVSTLLSNQFEVTISHCNLTTLRKVRLY